MRSGTSRMVWHEAQNGIKISYNEFLHYLHFDLHSDGNGLLKIERNSEHLALQSLEHRVHMMEYALRQKGPLSVRDGILMAGESVIDGDLELVDTIKEVFGGTATIFNGDVRVSTNVKKNDGSRSVGTKLTGPAYDAVFKRDMPYSGEVPILGIP